MQTRAYYFHAIRHTDARTHFRIDNKGIIIHKKRITTIERRIRQEIMEWIVLRGYREADTSAKAIAANAGARKEEVDSFVWSATGRKFASMRKDLRLEDAKQLLIECPDMTASEVGRAAGFKDNSDFRHQFIKEEDCSPAEWKKKMSVSGSGRSRCPSLDMISNWLNKKGLTN